MYDRAKNKRTLMNEFGVPLLTEQGVETYSIFGLFPGSEERAACLVPTYRTKLAFHDVIFNNLVYRSDPDLITSLRIAKKKGTNTNKVNKYSVSNYLSSWFITRFIEHLLNLDKLHGYCL